MTTGESLSGSEKVRGLQAVLHAALHTGLESAGHARRFRSEIVNYVDDLCVLGKAPAADMLAVVERLTAGLKLSVNERKTRCLRCPEETFEFLGNRIGATIDHMRKGPILAPDPARRASRAPAARSAT